MQLIEVTGFLGLGQMNCWQKLMLSRAKAEGF